MKRFLRFSRKNHQKQRGNDFWSVKYRVFNIERYRCLGQTLLVTGSCKILSLHQVWFENSICEHEELSEKNLPVSLPSGTSTNRHVGDFRSDDSCLRNRDFAESEFGENSDISNSSSKYWLIHSVRGVPKASGESKPVRLSVFHDL